MESPSVSLEEAARIMGRNMPNSDDVANCLGLVPCIIDSAKGIPFSKSTLSACAQTHLLIYVYALPALLVVNNRDSFQSGPASPLSRGRHPCLAKTISSWRLIRINPLEEIHGKNRDEQIKILANLDYPEQLVGSYSIVFTAIAVNKLLKLDITNGQEIRSFDKVNNRQGISISFSDKKIFTKIFAEGEGEHLSAIGEVITR